jgi:folate/biopterin transporter
MIVALVQGSGYLSKLAQNYYFKDDLHLSPATLSFVTGLTMLPWVIKPLYGFTSDSFPIFGYRRRPYLFIFGALGAMFWLIMAVAVGNNLEGAIFCLIGASLSVAFVNVLAEALIVERGGENRHDPEATKEHVSFLMTLYWGTESTAKIVSGFSSGFLIASISKQSIFGITAIFPFILCIVAFFVHEVPQRATHTIHEQWTTLIDHVKHPNIWKPAVFMFVWMAMPSSQASYFYFLTNDIGLKPEFMGTLQLVEGLSSIAGLTIYQLYLKQVSYRRILYWTIVLSFVAGATPLVLVTHFNRKLGLSDSWFIVGDSALLAGVGQVSLMPLLVLAAQTCPQNIEGTLYALLMSILNVGGVVSDALGGLLTYLVGVTAHDFSRLWILVCLCNAANLIPLAMLVGFVPQEKELAEWHVNRAAEEDSQEREQLLSNGKRE